MGVTAVLSKKTCVFASNPAPSMVIKVVVLVLAKLVPLP
jgi:hypothetical protein